MHFSCGLKVWKQNACMLPLFPHILSGISVVMIAMISNSVVIQNNKNTIRYVFLKRFEFQIKKQKFIPYKFGIETALQICNWMTYLSYGSSSIQNSRWQFFWSPKREKLILITHKNQWWLSKTNNNCFSLL